MAIIEVRDLVKRYGDFTAVKGISFDVGEGEIFGIVGPNGAGKTTTLEIIETLKDPTSGTVIIDGYDVVKNPWQVKRRIGVQLQAAGFYPGLSLRELLELFAGLYDVKVDPMAMLRKVQLEDKAKSRYEKLSGGQKQRFSIASTLVNQPRVIFLDEPSTGLDPQARLNLWDLVREIQKDGVTVVLTTHYMEEAEQLSNHLAIMDEGKIVASGTPDSLIDALLARGFKKPEVVRARLAGGCLPRLDRQTTPRRVTYAGASYKTRRLKEQGFREHDHRSDQDARCAARAGRTSDQRVPLLRRAGESLAAGAGAQLLEPLFRLSLSHRLHRHLRLPRQHLHQGDAGRRAGTDRQSPVYQALTHIPAVTLQQGDQATLDTQLKKGRDRRHPLHRGCPAPSTAQPAVIAANHRLRRHTDDKHGFGLWRRHGDGDSQWRRQQRQPGAGGRTSPAVQVTTSNISGQRYTYIDFALPGQLGFSLLSLAIFGTAFGFVVLKRTLVLKRIFATPTRPRTLIFGQGAARLVIAAAQVIVLLAVGVIFFNFHLANEASPSSRCWRVLPLWADRLPGDGPDHRRQLQRRERNGPGDQPHHAATVPARGTFFSNSSFPAWLQPIANNLPLSYMNVALRNSPATARRSGMCAGRCWGC